MSGSVLPRTGVGALTLGVGGASIPLDEGKFIALLVLAGVVMVVTGATLIRSTFRRRKSIGVS